MKALMFLLLLDYSGSMDQVIDGKIKIQQLQTEVKALLSTADPKAQSTALVFGTDPKQGCKDIRTFSSPTGILATKLKALRPGNQGRTPLAASLLQTVRVAMQSQAANIVVVTDGGDTCGQDPCEALRKADRELNALGTGQRPRRRLVVHIVGFDLKGESNNLQCLKNLTLDHIQVEMTEAGNASDLQSMLRNSQLRGVVESADLSDSELAKIKGAKRSRLSEAESGDVGKGELNQAAKTRLNKDEALLEITGAPSTASFSAQSVGGKDPKQWLGAYVVALNAGSYTLRYNDPNGTSLSLSLPAGTHTRIPWARLLKLFETQVTLAEPTLTLKWTASSETKQVHGEAEDFETTAKLSVGETNVQAVPFGDWELSVVSPPWLKDMLKNRQIKLEPGTSSLDIEQMFKDEVIWLNNPDPSTASVLSLQNPGGAVERHFIAAGQKRIPVARKSKIRWLKP